MNISLSLHQPLQSVLQNNRVQPWVRHVVLALVGSALIALAAQFSVPVQPVPITLQTLAVLFVAMAYGWRLGLTSVALYICEGLLGLPVFAEGKFGLAVLIGPSGGYIFGWLLAAFVSGFLVQNGWGKNWLGVFCAGLLGTIAMYGLGLPVLSAYVGWSQAMTLGVAPFLLGDLFKIIFLAFVIPFFWKVKQDK
ncbi:MAG: biotin biosynthesis protein BioY [Gammaproteobacteria bacterium]|jgi:biotin transport system substrate-specific component|nr:biotin biosynthesis protein BioY [Gammaproteobacteria bacterium]